MIQRTSYVVVLCAALGALAGAGSAAWVARTDEAKPSASRKTDVSEQRVTDKPTADSEQLGARVFELERRVATMQSLIQRLVLGQRAEAEKSSTDVNAAGSSELDIADPVFEAAVADIIDRDIERRRAERQEKRREKREQEINTSVAELATTLGLGPQQTAKMTELLHSHWEELVQVREDPAPNLSREERRAKQDALVSATEAKFMQLLNPRQVEEYRKLPNKQKIKMGGRSERDRPASPPND